MGWVARPAGHRKVGELLWARPSALAPFGKARGSSPAARAGLRFERSFGKALGPGAVLGEWFEFCDEHGEGFCQPDALVPLPGGGLLVAECKLSWTPNGHTQIRELYQPVVEMALGQAVVGVQVVKALVPSTPREEVRFSLGAALELAQRGFPSTFLWVGGNKAMVRLG